MKNPLVFFVGAAVAAIGVVAAATYERWQDWPAPLQTTGTPEVVDEYSATPPEPETEAPAPEAEAVEVVPPDEALPGDEAEVVLEEPAQEPEKQVEAAPEVVRSEPVEEMAEAPVAEVAPEPERLAAVDQQEPEAAAPDEPAVPEPEPDVAVNPSFDVVRLEDDGSLIAVGRAAPHATIELLLDGEVIATTSANEAGEWLVMPDNPLPSGGHELMVKASDVSGFGTRSSQVIALAVPERPGERPVVIGEPAQPPEAEPEEEVIAAPEPVLEEEPAPVERAEAPPSDTAEQDVALAPLPEPEVEPDAPALRQAEPPAAEEQPEEHAAVAPEPRMEPEREVEQVTEPLDVPLALETVDYNDKGDIVFSGRAASGRTVLIYVDGRLVGEATADGAGQWAFAGGEDIAPGRHTLRADLTDATGQVYGRILLPFVRAETRDVAALVESRRNAAEVREKAEAAPEPEPDAPVVTEEVAPEPEPARTVVAENAEPEPEPEAPMMAEEAAPEPEPEAPVVAEDVEPEPEPEAPMMTEEAAPEPEPEMPIMADEAAPAPGPELEAPMVAEEAEPEPEAPVMAEDVVPEPAREVPVVVAETAPRPAPEPAVAPQAAPGATRLEPVRPDERLRVAGIDEPGGHAAGEVVPARPGHVVIQPGNNLWRISRVIYGRGIEYTVIYQANRDQIRDPDLIYPGQIFLTPGVNPPKEIDPEWREPLNAEELARQDAAE
jgi:nucleoid-associated protein YgaU